MTCMCVMAKVSDEALANAVAKRQTMAPGCDPPGVCTEFGMYGHNYLEWHLCQANVKRRKAK